MTFSPAKRRLIRAIVVVSLLLAIAGIGFPACLESPGVQKTLLSSLNKLSKWQFGVDHLTWNPFTSRINVDHFIMTRADKGHRIEATKASIRYKVLPLIMGRIGFHDISADSLDLDFSKASVDSIDNPKKMSWKQIFWLQNVTIDHATLTQVSVMLPKTTIHSEGIGLSFEPTLLGKIHLVLTTQAGSVLAGNALEHMIAIEGLRVDGRSDVSHWTKSAPFISDITAVVSARRSDYRDFHFSDASITGSFKNSRLSIGALDAKLNEKPFSAKGYLFVSTHNYRLDLSLPSPIPIPNLGGDTAVIRTEGMVSGDIFVEAIGYNPTKGSGSYSINITHETSAIPQSAIHVESAGSWKDGVLTISPSTVNVGDGTISANGKVDVGGESINIDFEGKNVALHPVFARFYDPAFNPIAGTTSLTGKYNGWGKSYHIGGKAIVTKPQYYDIVLDQANVDVDVTYQTFSLNGIVLQKETPKGRCNMSITYGNRMADGTRYKEIDLAAEVNDVNLGEAMGAYDLSGSGTATYNLKGPTKTLKATGHAELTHGAFIGLEFDSVTTDVVMNDKTMVFSHTTFDLPSFPHTSWPHDLTMHIKPEGIFFAGTPTEGLEIDAQYRYATRSWNIPAISFHDPNLANNGFVVKGTISPTSMDISANGHLDALALRHLTTEIRSGEGPIGVNLHVHGAKQSPNIDGDLQLQKNRLLLTTLGYPVENTSGTIRFNSKHISIERITGQMEWGHFELSGSMDHSNFTISHYNLALNGDSLYWSSPDRLLKLQYDANLTLTGDASSPLLAGQAQIIDGRYTKSFNILKPDDAELVPEGHRQLREATEPWQKIRLDVAVHTSGDVWIRNNAADIALSANLKIGGTLGIPSFIGTISVLDGEVHYLGLQFAITKGVLEFRDPYTDPFVDITAEKEIGDENVSIHLRGPMDRLTVEATSSSGLNQQEVLSLIAFGMTSLEQRRTGQPVGAGMAAGQIAGIFERPLSKLTKLDMVRLESVDSANGDGQYSRLRLGKKISDRLSVEFATDINSDTADQQFQAEYLLTDFFLIKGLRRSENNFQLDISLRFRER